MQIVIDLAKCCQPERQGTQTKTTYDVQNVVRIVVGREPDRDWSVVQVLHGFTLTIFVSPFSLRKHVEHTSKL